MKCFLFFALILVSTIFAQNSKKKVAVYKFESGVLKPEQTLEISKFITDELRKYPNLDVLDWANVGQVLGFVEEQKAVGDLSTNNSKAQCSSDKCYAELGSRLGVELMLVGSVNQIGSRYLVNMSLQDIENVKVLGTAKAQIKGDLGDILDSLPNMVSKVLNASEADKQKMLILAKQKEQEQKAEQERKAKLQKQIDAENNQKIREQKQQEQALAEQKLNEKRKQQEQADAAVEALRIAERDKNDPHYVARQWTRWGGLGVGVVGILYAAKQNQEVTNNAKLYSIATSDFDTAWNKVEASRKQRNLGLVLSGLGLTAFSVSFLF